VQDNTKRTTIKIMIVIMIIVDVVCLCVGMIPFYDNDTIRLVLLLTFIIVSFTVLLISFLLAKSIKAMPSKKTVSFLTFSVGETIDFEDKLNHFGQVVKFSENESYVTFSEKGDLFSKNLIIIAKIEVDSNYSKEDYVNFMKSIPQLTRDSRETIDDFTNYRFEIRIIVFVEKENCDFVNKYIKNQVWQWRKSNTICVYNERTKKVKILKIDDVNFTLSGKYVNQIFTTKTSVQNEKEMVDDCDLDNFIDPLNPSPSEFSKL
jgi:hypothetical protein